MCRRMPAYMVGHTLHRPFLPMGPIGFPPTLPARLHYYELRTGFLKPTFRRIPHWLGSERRSKSHHRRDSTEKSNHPRDGNQVTQTRMSIRDGVTDVRSGGSSLRGLGRSRAPLSRAGLVITSYFGAFISVLTTGAGAIR